LSLSLSLSLSVCPSLVAFLWSKHLGYFVFSFFPFLLSFPFCQRPSVAIQQSTGVLSVLFSCLLSFSFVHRHRVHQVPFITKALDRNLYTVPTFKKTSCTTHFWLTIHFSRPLPSIPLDQPTLTHTYTYTYTHTHSLSFSLSLFIHITKT
ncbi:MAG: hypothetical protein BYD32DRAFT_449311, partial [Podila humilis]